MKLPPGFHPLLAAVGLLLILVFAVGLGLTVAALAAPRLRAILWPVGVRPVPPKVLPVAICVALMLLANLGTAMFGSGLVRQFGLWVVPAATILMQGLVFPAVYVVVRFGGPDGSAGLSAVGLNRPRARELASGAAAFVCVFWMVVATGLLTLLAYRLSGHDAPAQPVIRFMLRAPTGLRLVLAAAAVVLAPVAEEVLFRGAFFGSLRAVLGFWPAALGSSLLFAAAHQSLGQMPSIFVLGLALCWLYNRTGSLWPGIVLHAIQNGLMVFLVLAGASRLS